MVYNLISSSLFLRMIRFGANNLANNKNIINQLNVFPVPDGDTGTNMNLSMQSGIQTLQEIREAELPVLLKKYVNGLLMGARGNSGVILSQLFKGFQESLQNKTSINAKDFAAALENGVNKAYSAVTKPVEGTILTVAKEAAKGAKKSAATTEDMIIVMKNTLDAAKQSLQRTPELLPVLKEVGVVDSGGKGLVVIYEGFLAALQDKELPAVINETDMEEQIKHEHHQVIQSFLNTDEIEFGYCTEFFVEFTEDKLTLHPFNEDQFRNRLSEFGDSLLLAATEKFIKVHIHTEEPGKVLTIGQTYGNLMNIDIENMRKQHEELTSDSVVEREKKASAVIAVALGSGMEKMMKSIGADIIISGGQTMNPSTEDILTKIEQANADMVYILPNNKNILLAATQASELTDKRVIIIPAKSIPQGIAALFAFDEEAEPEKNTRHMNEAVQHTKTGQITTATRDTVVNGIHIQENAYIGMNDETIIATDLNKETVLKQLVEQLVDEDDELLTVFFGEGVTEEETAALKSYLLAELDVEVECYEGNQPLYPYILMVE